jgi:hypothetical protein
MAESGQRLEDLLEVVKQPLEWKRYVEEGKDDCFRTFVNDKGIAVFRSKICVYKKGFDFYDKNGKWEDDRHARECFTFGIYTDKYERFPAFELYEYVKAQVVAIEKKGDYLGSYDRWKENLFK